MAKTDECRIGLVFLNLPKKFVLSYKKSKLTNARIKTRLFRTLVTRETIASIAGDRVVADCSLDVALVVPWVLALIGISSKLTPCLNSDILALIRERRRKRERDIHRISIQVFRFLIAQKKDS